MQTTILLPLFLLALSVFTGLLILMSSISKASDAEQKEKGRLQFYAGIVLGNLQHSREYRTLLKEPAEQIQSGVFVINNVPFLYVLTKSPRQDIVLRLHRESETEFATVTPVALFGIEGIHLFLLNKELRTEDMTFCEERPRAGDYLTVLIRDNPLVQTFMALPAQTDTTTR